MSGSKPGERRGGRKKGTPNKATAELRDLAQSYAPDALKQLKKLMTSAKSESARVAAIKEILDRGYGKAVQSNENENTHDIADPMVELLKKLNQPVFPGEQ